MGSSSNNSFGNNVSKKESALRTVPFSCRTKKSMRLPLVGLTLTAMITVAQGFAGTSPLAAHFSGSVNAPLQQKYRKSSLQMYVQPNTATSQTAPMVSQAFFSPQHSNSHSRNNGSNNRKNASCLPYSKSILASSDTLPSFSTAHGLLSPESVMRMELLTQGTRDDAVDYFLETYRNQGPMACLPMLSDPKVLPHLTEAYREIIA